MTLEDTLTSRDKVSAALRHVLDEATGKWGIRVNRVELKAVDPPASIQEAMEKQMRAERDRRAAILTAEGVKQSQILTAEGEKQSAILRAEGQREAQILEAEGQSKAIETVFDAIHRGDADPKLLAYQYLQMLPQIAQGESNKVWIIPSEVTAGAGEHRLDHPEAGPGPAAPAGSRSTRTVTCSVPTAGPPPSSPCSAAGADARASRRRRARAPSPYASGGRRARVLAGWPRCCGRRRALRPCSATIHSVSPSSVLPTGIWRS